MDNFKKLFDEQNNERKDKDDDNTIVFEEFVDVNKKKKKKVQLPKEAKGAGLDIVYYPTNKKNIPQRPTMEADIIPRHPSRVIFNGPSGSGKTNLCVNIMSRPEFLGKDKNGKPYFDLIFLFSPTSEADDLVQFLEIPNKRIFPRFDINTLDNIIETQKEIIEKNGGIENGGLNKAPKILIIFEDIQSDKKFMSSKSFLQCFVMSRHYSISVYLLGQAWNLTPRSCRLNASNIFFFACSQSEHKLLVDEFTPPRLTKKEFAELVDHATEEDYSFLHINKHVGFKERHRKNLKEILKLTK